MDDLEDYQKRRSAAENRRRQRAERTPSGTGSRFKCCLLMVMLFGIITALVLGVVGYFVFQMVTDKYQKYAESFDLNEINNLEHPLFAYMKTPFTNNLDMSPVGISFFANAIDQLEELDNMRRRLEQG